MGMHVGLIAARVSVDALREAFLGAWTELEVVASEGRFEDAEEMWAWKKRHEQFVSATDWSKENPGTEVYVLWRDGPWAVLVDESYTLSADEEKMKALSDQLGTVVSFVVETAGGCAMFQCFEAGRLRRRIDNADGAVTTEGEPLAEEAGIDVGRYYMAESEALARALGLSLCYEDASGTEGSQAVSVADRTDYGATLAKGVGERRTGELPLAKKPWWRFW